MLTVRGRGQHPGERPPRASEDRGAALVEFAIIAIALVTLVFGTIDLGRAYITWTSVKNAAREGAAFAERNPLAQKNGADCPNPNNIEYRAQTERGSRDTSYVVTVTATDPGGTPRPAVPGGCQLPSDSQAIVPGDHVTVRVEKSFSPISPLVAVITGGDFTISASQTVVVQG